MGTPCAMHVWFYALGVGTECGKNSREPSDVTRDPLSGLLTMGPIHCAPGDLRDRWPVSRVRRGLSSAILARLVG